MPRINLGAICIHLRIACSSKLARLSVRFIRGFSMRNGSSFGLAAGSLAAVLASTSAMAEAGPANAAAADSGTQLDEIVVTARRRAESLQDVPVTVAVVNAAALETRGIH